MSGAVIDRGGQHPSLQFGLFSLVHAAVGLDLEPTQALVIMSWDPMRIFDTKHSPEHPS